MHCWRSSNKTAECPARRERSRRMVGKLLFVGCLIGIGAGCCGRSTDPPLPTALGHFDADIACVNLLADGRTAKLTHEFTYIDSKKLPWSAPATQQTDGASIPAVFW